MSFSGDFCPRRSRSHSLRFGRIDSQADSRLFRIERLVGPRASLIAEVRSDRQGITLAGNHLSIENPVINAEKLAQFGGDFAFALIDENAPRLVLGLAPLSELELYYRRRPNGKVSFATNLASLVTAGEQPDPLLLAKSLGFDAFVDEERGLYDDLFRVQPGTFVEILEARRYVRRFWDPRELKLCEMSDREAAVQLRSALKRAIESRLAAVPGATASLLSAGRDSSAVTAIAARELGFSGERLDAWTAAAFAGTRYQGRHLLDEAPQASETAARFPNITHHVLRPERIDLCTRLDEIHRAVAVPIIQPLAVGWCETLWNACEANGNRLLLGGGFGNYALSAGGLSYLEDVRLESGVLTWLSRSLATAAAAPSRLRPLAGAMLGHRWKTRDVQGQPPVSAFVRGPLAPRSEFGTSSSKAATKSYRTWLLDGIRVSIDPHDSVRIGRQLEATDPTRDRRLVELVHSLPSRLLASADNRRRIYDHAFGDLLPRTVLRPRARGLQNVDWHYTYCPRAMRDGLARYKKSALVREMIDCDKLNSELGHWPATRTINGELFSRMVWGALPALSLASFLHSRESAAQA